MSKRLERERKRAEWALLVGRAFRGGDGLVRWITHLSTRDYFTLLWLDERSNVWHAGGIVKAGEWEGGEEVTAPPPGERYMLAVSFGTASERTVPAPERDRAAPAGGERGGE